MSKISYRIQCIWLHENKMKRIYNKKRFDCEMIVGAWREMRNVRDTSIAPGITTAFSRWCMASHCFISRPLTGVEKTRKPVNLWTIDCTLTRYSFLCVFFARSRDTTTLVITLTIKKHKLSMVPWLYRIQWSTADMCHRILISYSRISCQCGTYVMSRVSDPSLSSHISSSKWIECVIEKEIK